MPSAIRMNAVLIAVIAVAALAACDNVKVPGRDSARTETPGPVTPAAPAPGGETSAPAPGEQPAVPVPTDTSAVAPVERPKLAALNAARCGLPAGAIATPTIAQVAGATQLAEPAFGTAAVNGAAASLASFPGIVKIEPRLRLESGNYASGHCGATRIARNWLITAAHCVDEKYDEIRVIGEAANLRAPNAKVTDAAMALCHAAYQGAADNYANDIALIRLNEEEVATIKDVPIARYGATAKPLLPLNYVSADMAGWGLTSYGGQLSPDLLMAKLKVASLGPAAINVSSQGGAGPCVGDSGGPLYVTEADGTKTVIGVLSVVERSKATGEFCNGDYGGRYTNLQGFSGWISDVMALCDQGEEACQ